MNSWMNLLLEVFGFAFLAIMGLFCVMLLYKIWTNQINLSTLLKEANGDASMSRLQLLIFTLVVAVGMFLYMLTHLALPDLPQSILILLGVSASTYAAGKGISFSRIEGVTKPGTTIIPQPPPLAPIEVTPPPPPKPES
jgi:hypothetical protein